MPSHAVLVAGPDSCKIAFQTKDDFESEETFFFGTSHDKSSFFQKGETVNGVETRLRRKQRISKGSSISELEK